MISTLLPIHSALVFASDAPTVDERIDKILAAVATIIVLLGTLVRFVFVAKTRLDALVGAIKSTETALEPLRATHPTVYLATKARLEAALEDEGVNGLIAPLVETVIHGDGKPGTKPHASQHIKADV